MLRLNVPIGPADANGEVEVTIEPAASKSQTSAEQEEWRGNSSCSRLRAWQGELERPEQGEYEVRDELP